MKCVCCERFTNFGRFIYEDPNLSPYPPIPVDILFYCNWCWKFCPTETCTKGPAKDKDGNCNHKFIVNINLDDLKDNCCDNCGES